METCTIKNIILFYSTFFLNYAQFYHGINLQSLLSHAQNVSLK